MLVRAIIDLAHSLGMTTVAEGVETLDQQRFLNLHGCDDAQGFFISRPLTAEAFEQAHANWESTANPILAQQTPHAVE